MPSLKVSDWVALYSVFSNGVSKTVRLGNLRPLEQSCVDGQAPDPHPGGSEDGIGHSGGKRRYARFAHATWRFGAWDNVDLYFRRLIYAQDGIVVKVALFDGSIFDGNLAGEDWR